MTTVTRKTGPSSQPLDLKIQQSSQWSVEGKVSDDQDNPIDLSNKDVFGLVLKDVSEPHKDQNIIYEFTVANGRVTILNASDGLFELTLSVSEVESLPFEREDYVVMLDDQRLVEGELYLG